MVHVVPNSLWVYAPTKGVSIAFAVLFLISGLLHIWQNNIKYRSWRIGFLLPWAAALFVAGFSLREYAAWGHYTYPEALNVFIASTVLLFVAPPVYNGANYFIFGRTLYYLPYLSPIHPGRVFSTFIFLDAVVGVLAGNGASYASNTKNTPEQRKVGEDLVKAALIMQLGMFSAFVSLIVIFHRRAIRKGVFTHKVKVIVYELYVSSFLIVLRNAFRTATFFYPFDSFVNGTEAFFWVFEALPMLVNTYIANVWPPAKYFPSNTRTYLAVDGKTELQGPCKLDNRPFLLTFFDPFDIVGIINHRDRRNRYWEQDGIGGPLKDEEEPKA